MLLPRVIELLVAQHRQYARQAFAGGVRHDHFVDITTFGRHERRQDTRFIFGSPFGDFDGVGDIGDADKIAARTKEYEDRFLSPFIAAERGYIDDVIMPHSTRRRIARALAMLRDKKVEMPAKKHDNLPL